MTLLRLASLRRLRRSFFYFKSIFTYCWVISKPHLTFTCCQQRGIHGGVVEFSDLPERSKLLWLHLLVVSRGSTTRCITNQIESTRKATVDFYRGQRQRGTLFRGCPWVGTGAPRSQETASPQDPTAGLCLGPYCDPRGGRPCCAWRACGGCGAPSFAS